MSSDSETDDEKDNDYDQFVMQYDVDADHLEAGDTSADDEEEVVGIICYDHIQIDTEAYGVYELQILESQAGRELFYIDISAGGKSVSKASGKTSGS